MKKIKKSVSILLLLMMVISLFAIVPVTANAAGGVAYIYRSWDPDNHALIEETRMRTDYTDLSTYTPGKDHTLTQGWYVAANVTFGQLTTTGDVHIIVPNGVNMKCTKGILVIHKLNIYGQQGDEGILDVSNSKNDYAAIGGSDTFDAGEINIFGGTVKAQSSDDAAGIGSGENHGFSYINIYGGNVTAIGSAYGAGIGSGASGKFGTVTIYGGDVTATGGKRGAGIGGGNRCDGSHVFILGGTVKATGGVWSAGIGGGNKGLGGVLKISGGSVTAKGGDGGAGVGGGDGACRLDITNIWSTALNFEMSAGELTAIGGDEAAGIGGGNQEENRTDGYINISGGTITATGGRYYGAGIGGGDQQENSSPVTITGGKVTATGGINAAGIGSGDKGSSRGITITGGEVIANGGTNGAGIGSGNGAACGTINISIEDSITAPDSKDGTVTATGGTNGAGIGSGNASENVTVNIAKASNVTAFGGEAAAGIGGGNNKTSFGNVTISDSATVVAAGGRRAAGIGGGEKATAGSVTINGADDLQAAGGIGGAGIGKGSGTASDSITVTINGGIVSATGGNGLFNEREQISLNCAPAIGGSSFCGTINLNRGNITALGAQDDYYDTGAIHAISYGHGTAIGSNSSNPRTGTVNITAGAVIDTKIEGYEAAPSYHYYANAINFIDTEEGCSCVQYDSALAASADRAKACGWKARVIHIEPCRHGDFTCENKGSDHHKVICLYCPFTDEEPHNDVLTSWTWSSNNTKAAASFTCAACGNTVSVEATVGQEIGSDGDRYTATAEHNGISYTTVRITNTDGQIVDDGVVITWKNSDGSIIQSSVVALGEVPSCVISPKKPGADSASYDLVGWSDGDNYYINGDPVPEARTQTVYTPVYKYREQTEPYIDASGEYIPGKEKHYLINGKFYEINEADSSVGVVRDSVDVSYFVFELLGDDTYRINKYTGSTDNLTELVIPKSYKAKPVTVVGDDLQNKLFPDETMPRQTFTLVLNENITTIGAYTFWGVKVAKVTGDTSALSHLHQSAFSYSNTADDRTLDIRLDYPGMIDGALDAFDGMNVTACVKHATYFNNVANLHAKSLSYVFTDAHRLTQEWQWNDDYSSAALTLKCSDSRCELQETFNADVTSKTTENKIIYTAAVEAMGERYTDTREKKISKVTVLEADHGKIEASVQRACAGDPVQVTVTPEEGCHLSSISVVKDTTVPLTYVMGGTADGDETADKLVDGNKFTTWSQRGAADIFLKAEQAVKMVSYSLTTGNTAAEHPESNWGSWTICGANFASDSDMTEHAYEESYWEKLDEKLDDTSLPAVNNQTCDFTPDVPPSGDYQYYRITVSVKNGADFIQMSEFELKTEEADVALTGEGNSRSFTMPEYPVLVSAAFEADLHTVTWLDENGTELAKDENVPYGSRPEYKGITPSRTGCTFMGWSDGESAYAPDELPEVTGDVTYTAVFGSGDGLGSTLVGHSISLDGDIAVNFYMELSDFVIAHEETAYMRFAVPVENGTTEQKVYVRNAEKKETGDKTYYVFKCRVAAKEMSSDIKARLIDGSREGTEYTYSVKEYAQYLIEHANDSAEYLRAVPLVKKMLNYGAYAQIYFDKNTTNLANAILSDEEKALGDVTITGPQTAIALPAGVSFVGATLSLKSETSVSLYFTSETALTFLAGGKTVETVSSGRYQIARIRGIAARELHDSFTLNVTAGEAQGSVVYSPMTYCCTALTSSDEKLVNTVKALYLYWVEADKFFNQGNS